MIDFLIISGVILVAIGVVFFYTRPIRKKVKKTSVMRKKKHINRITNTDIDSKPSPEIEVLGSSILNAQVKKGD